MKLKDLLSEIDFSSQSAFDAYKEKHKMRDTTKVNVAGKETTVGAASKKSKKSKEEPTKKQTAKKSAEKHDLGVDKVVYNTRTKTVGIVRMADERGETKTDADGNVNTSELEPYNPTKYPHQKDAKVAPSTQKEVDKRGLWNPFASSKSKKETSSPKHTPTKEDSPVVKTISQFTTLRTKALSDFINKHKLDADAIAKFVEKGSLKDRIMVGTAMVANPGNEYEKKIIAKFGEKEEAKKEEPKSEPVKKRPGNPTVNKEAKKTAEEYGITPQKLGNDGYKKTMIKAAVEALTDANFHDEARELVAAVEKKPEWAKKVNYPSFDDPKYQEKMADIRKNGVDSSEYWNGDDNAHEYGRKVSAAAGWGGVEAADGIAFALRMNGFHKEADTIQSIFDNKPYMK